MDSTLTDEQIIRCLALTGMETENQKSESSKTKEESSVFYNLIKYTIFWQSWDENQVDMLYSIV